MSVRQSTVQAQKFRVELTPGQMEVYSDPHRFRVLATGRRWGKTRFGCYLCIETAMRGGRAWWVAPSYPIATIGWAMLKEICALIPDTKVRAGEWQITFPSGGWIQCRSGDNPDSLRGQGLDLVVFDECAFMSDIVWKEAIRPALSDRKGRALFISSPKGQNWFWHLFLRGKDPASASWSSYQFATATNPLIDPEEIEEARLDLPESTFNQEYLAAFVDDNSGVFRKVNQCATGMLFTDPYPGQFVMGVDWGQTQDFTVVTVMDVKRRTVVDFDRFNKISWDFQRNRIALMHNKWEPMGGLVEFNSIGSPNLEALRDMGIDLQPWVATNETKRLVIQDLALGMETGDVSYPVIPALVGELMAYTTERTPSGLIKYTAPEGMHDDTVISLALAYQAAKDIGGAHSTFKALGQVRGHSE